MENLEQKTRDYFKVEVMDIVLPFFCGLFKYNSRVKKIHTEKLDRILEDYPASSKELRDGLKLLSSIGNKIEAREFNLFLFHSVYFCSLVYGLANLIR